MKKKSIFKQLLIPVLLIVCVLAISLVSIMAFIYSRSYEKNAYNTIMDMSDLLSKEIGTFIDGAYSVTEELAVNPSVLTMDTDVQTGILSGCVERNSYLELLYIQGTDGMQTGRSSGELADRSTRWWFTQVMEQKKPFASKSYYSVNTGMPCASIFFPMYGGSDMRGIFAADLKLDYLQNLIEEFSDTENGKISFVIDGEGVVVAHPDNKQIEEQYNYKELFRTVSEKDANGNSVTDADGNIVTKEETFSISQDFQQVITTVMSGDSGCRKIKTNGKTWYISYSPVSLKGESDSWSVITMWEYSATMASASRLVVISVIIVLIAICLAIGIMVFIARKLTYPVVSVTDLIRGASEGNFTTRANENIENELGVLSKSFNQLIEKMAGILEKMSMFTDEVEQSSDKLKSIEEDINNTYQSVEGIVDGTYNQTQDAKKVVARAAELEDKFKEMHIKSGSLLDSAENTLNSGLQGAQSVEDLKQRNQTTVQMMEKACAEIMKLAEHSQHISGIVNTISGISEETALLSLNASIEAARAGEAGRGFAVVAESIGKLAANSQTATENVDNIIQELCTEISATVEDITAIQEGIKAQTEAVDIVEGAFESFQELVRTMQESVSDMDVLVEEMHKLDRSMVHAADRIRDVSQSTAEVVKDIEIAMQEQVDGIQCVTKQVYHLSVEAETIKENLGGKMEK